MSSRYRALADAVAAIADGYTADQVLCLFKVEKPRKLPTVFTEDAEARVWFYPLGLTTERQRAMVVRQPAIAVLFTAPLDEAKPLDFWEEAAQSYMELLERLAVPVAGFRLQNVESNSLWDPSAAENGRFAALHQLVFAATDVLR